MSSVSHIEEAIQALGRGDHVGARMAVEGLPRTRNDHIAIIDAVHYAATELEQDDQISDATWNGLADSLLDSEMEGLIDLVRS